MVLRMGSTVAVVGPMFLAGFVVPVLYSPAALALSGLATLALTQLRDRRTALVLAGIAVVGLALATWVAVQPSYVLV